MKIEVALEEDVPAIMGIYDACKSDMNKKGVDQWPNNYPNSVIVARDIRHKSLFKVVHDKIIFGVICINEYEDPAYRTISWSAQNGKVLVIHRLAVDPQKQGFGIGRQLMDFAENFAEKNNYHWIRLDAYIANKRSTDFYFKRKYIVKGQVYFSGREKPFYCMEKKMKDNLVQTNDVYFLRTDALNTDFVDLVKMLDSLIAKRDGEDHSFYAPFNKVDQIKHVLLAYIGTVPVACGSIKQFDEKTMEVKRMFVRDDYRGKGIATKILDRLEEWAREMNYKKCILETGKKYPEAIKLYTKNDYYRIPNYAQYIGVEDSVCFEKIL